jgi:hypothetical protein
MNNSILKRTQALGRRVLWLSLALPLCGIAFAVDVDVPSLQQGQWEYHRSITVAGQKQPAVQTMRKCINPTEDIRSKWQELARQTCHFSPVRHTDNKYQYSAMCTKNGVRTRTMSVITVQGEAAYNVVTESISSERRFSESLSAHRVGDCSPSPTAAPAPSTPTS